MRKRLFVAYPTVELDIPNEIGFLVRADDEHELLELVLSEDRGYVGCAFTELTEGDSAVLGLVDLNSVEVGVV